MTLNGLFFAHLLRQADCITVVDVLQRSYGRVFGGLLYLPACIGDVCWTAAVLSALGGTLAVILEAKEYSTICVWVSAVVTVGYTLIGGMYSVAYTDVVQMALVLFGLWLAVPFVAVKTDFSSLSATEWTGEITQKVRG